MARVKLAVWIELTEKLPISVLLKGLELGIWSY